MQICLGGKVNKIFEPTKTEVIFGFYTSGKNVALLANVQPETARLHCTTHSKPNPFQAPNFCMLLRKHLVGAKLAYVNTFDLERVLELDFETHNELNDIVIKKIFIEVMASHSNIILTNYNNVIIDSLRHVVSPTLEIMPARIYELPHNSKHSFLKLADFNEFARVMPQTIEEPIDKVLSDTFIGISRSFIQNLLQSHTISATPNNDELQLIYNEIKNITQNFSNISLKLNDDGNDYSVYLNNAKEPLEVNFFLDDFYAEKEEKSLFLQKRNQLLSQISAQLKKYTKRLENINVKLQECQDMEKYRIYGELLTSNLYRYSPHTNLEKITVQNYYDEQKEITISLDKKYSLNKNVEKFFKKYNKLKNTLKIVSIQKKETQIELEYIQSILFSIENSTTIQELEDIANEINESDILDTNHNHNSQFPKKSKVEIKSSPLEFNIDGFTVLVGKNNKQNDTLTLKIANRQDIWFHVQNIQGSHVILKTENKHVPDNVIFKCATLAAQNSKAKNSSHVAVDYCLVKNVKKPSGTRPGMVIYNNFKTVTISLDK